MPPRKIDALLALRSDGKLLIGRDRIKVLEAVAEHKGREGCRLQLQGRLGCGDGHQQSSTEPRFRHQGGRQELRRRRSHARGTSGSLSSPAFLFRAPERARRLPRDQGRSAGPPGKLGSQQISDPSGRFDAFDIAGYGVIMNAPLAAKEGLSPPKGWRDLANPDYVRRLVMPIRTKVDFSPALYWSFVIAAVTAKPCTSIVT